MDVTEANLLRKRITYILVRQQHYVSYLRYYRTKSAPGEKYLHTIPPAGLRQPSATIVEASVYKQISTHEFVKFRGPSIRCSRGCSHKCNNGCHYYCFELHIAVVNADVCKKQKIEGMLQYFSPVNMVLLWASEDDLAHRLIHIGCGHISGHRHIYGYVDVSLAWTETADVFTRLVEM
jgi:hypothetical protein